MIVIRTHLKSSWRANEWHASLISWNFQREFHFHLTCVFSFFFSKQLLKFNLFPKNEKNKTIRMRRLCAHNKATHVLVGEMQGGKQQSYSRCSHPYLIFAFKFPPPLIRRRAPDFGRRPGWTKYPFVRHPWPHPGTPLSTLLAKPTTIVIKTYRIFYLFLVDFSGSILAFIAHLLPKGAESKLQKHHPPQKRRQRQRQKQEEEMGNGWHVVGVGEGAWCFPAFQVPLMMVPYSLLT